MSRADWPLDRALERLRMHQLPYKWDEEHLNTWHAVCVCCKTPAWTLTAREHGRGGQIDLRCSAGCDPADIATVLEREPAEEQIEAANLRAAAALRVAEQARDVAGHALDLIVEHLGTGCDLLAVAA